MKPAEPAPAAEARASDAERRSRERRAVDDDGGRGSRPCVITAPTDRSRPPVSTGTVCAMATSASANASLAFWTSTADGEALRMERL